MSHYGHRRRPDKCAHGRSGAADALHCVTRTGFVGPGEPSCASLLRPGMRVEGLPERRGATLPATSSRPRSRAGAGSCLGPGPVQASGMRWGEAGSLRSAAFVLLSRRSTSQSLPIRRASAARTFAPGTGGEHVSDRHKFRCSPSRRAHARHLTPQDWPASMTPAPFNLLNKIALQTCRCGARVPHPQV